MSVALLLTVSLAAQLPAGPQQEEGAETTGPGDRARASGAWNEDPVYEAARRGLDFLAAHQNRDGSWDGDIGFKLDQNYEVTRHTIAHVA